MTARKPRWPSIDEMIESARKGVIDDREDLIPPYDLEEWDILGTPPPESEEAPESQRQKRRLRRHRSPADQRSTAV